MRKIGKKEAALQRRRSLLSKFQQANVKCIRNNICISAECIVDKAKWRIIVEKRDKDGGVLERSVSDEGKTPVTYLSKEEYENKIMEITCFYAESF